MGHDFSAKRINYGKHRPLNEQTAPTNPYTLFSTWFDDALNEKGIEEAYIMFLATATLSGIPSVRTVLLREYGKEGLVFYTNYNSRKGQEIDENPNVSLLFFWDVLERQVRIEGSIEKIEAPKSDAYFNSRPEESQYAAMVSPQSEAIESRTWLIKKMDEAKQHEAKRPAHWGGYVVKPVYFEFWQGGANRLHDRLSYTQQNDSWLLKRLAP